MAERPFSVSSISLLIPPLRLMSAVMWEVVRLRNVRHYGKVMEFVSLVTEAVPDIMSDRQKRLLTVALRTKMTLMQLNSQHPEDLDSVRTHLERLRPPHPEQGPFGNEALETNFVKLIQTLLDDPDRRNHFLMNVFPVDYGADFDSALEDLVCRFFTRLEELMPVPDFKQAAVWIKDAPFVLEEHMCVVSKVDDLKELLESKLCNRKLAKMDVKNLHPSEHHLLRSLSLPPSLRETPYQDCLNTEPEACLKDDSTAALEKQAGGTKEAEERSDSEGIPLQEEEAAVEVQEAGWTSEEEGMATGPPMGDEEGPQSLSGHSVALAGAQTPSSSEGPVAMSLGRTAGAPRQRVAHKCAHCDRCFIYRYELLEHQRLHTGENPYKCSQCGKAFRRTGNLSAHRRTQCTKAAYVCIKCGNSFKSIQDRLRHKCTQPQAQKLVCAQCGKTFKTLYLLDKHQLTHTQTQSRLFTCRQCGEACPGMSELRAHQKIHPPEQANQCMRCGKFFSSVTSLTAHEMRHNQQRTQICVHCGKGFKSKYGLNLHMRSHTGERPFQCSYCGKRFSVSGNLTIHIRIHTGEKPHLCSDCGKTFVSAGELQIHRRTHTGEKPYKCTVCEKAFTMASKLTLHMRVHTGERPYVCLECGKGFSRGSELKQHTLNHSGVRPYACQLCSKTYTCHNHLKRHLKTHSVHNTA